MSERFPLRWHRWFAWYPVWSPYFGWTWLQPVERAFEIVPGPGLPAVFTHYRRPSRLL